MAVTVERLIATLEARFDKYERSLNKALGNTDRTFTRIERRGKAMERRLAGIGSNFGASLTKALAVAGGVRGFQTLLDSATRIDNALKVAGLSGEELERVYARLRDSAMKNAAPIETLVELYSRASMAAGNLGASQEDLIRFSENVALSLRVSGQSATEAAGALLQLSQLLSGSVVQAQEYNSLIDGAYPLLQAVAAGLKEAGGDVGKLTQLVKAGEVPTRAFFEAFQAGAIILEEKVAGATLTTEQGLTNIKTAMVDAARRFAQGSTAAESLGEAFGIMAEKINSIDFKQFGEQARELVGMISQIREAMGWLQNIGANLGSALGTDAVGNWLNGGDAFRSYLGGSLTITSQRGLQDRIDRAFGDAVDTASGLTEDAIRRSAGTVTGAGKTGRLPTSKVTPVSLGDYENSSEKGAKKRADDYQRLSQRIAESTAALVAETEAQRQLNPLIDDYGYAVEKARAEQELLSAAKEAGLAITPALRSEIANLADQYALASAEAAKLAEEQDKARENAEKWLGVGQDVTKGFIDDLINGKSAAESFATAISKIGDALLDDVLSAIFDIKNASGGGFLGFLGSLFGGGTNWGALSASGKYLFDTGGYTGNGGKHEPKGVVHGGEYVFSKDAVRKAGVGNLEALHRSLKGYAMGGYVAPTTASMARPSAGPAGGASVIQVLLSPDLEARLLREAGNQSIQITQAGLRQFDLEAGPAMVKRVVNDPRAVG